MTSFFLFEKMRHDINKLPQKLSTRQTNEISPSTAKMAEREILHKR